MDRFIFQDELDASTVEAASIVFSMVSEGLDANELPPKDILEWFAKFSVYQLAMAETKMLAAEDDALAEKLKGVVTGLSGLIRHLMGLAAAGKMFWLQATLDELLQMRRLRLPEAYQSLLQPDALP